MRSALSLTTLLLLMALPAQADYKVLGPAIIEQPVILTPSTEPEMPPCTRAVMGEVCYVDAPIPLARPVSVFVPVPSGSAFPGISPPLTAVALAERGMCEFNLLFAEKVVRNSAIFTQHQRELIGQHWRSGDAPSLCGTILLRRAEIAIQP